VAVAMAGACVVVWVVIEADIVGTGFVNVGGRLDGFRSVRVWRAAIKPAGVGDGERDVFGAPGVGDGGSPNISKTEGCPSSSGESRVLGSIEDPSSIEGFVEPVVSCSKVGGSVRPLYCSISNRRLPNRNPPCNLTSSSW
jgi:hypothetical protein